MLSKGDESQHFVIHPLLREESVEFRAYQNNIFQSAIDKNTLVILPTALGKTIISLLVCANTLYNYKDNRVLIMAPTRPLVNQHLISFYSTLKILEDQVALLTGKIIPTERIAVWTNSRIKLIFATPEVVRNDILEGRLSLKDFILLVFDEAHRAVKDYAYTFVASEYIKQSIHPVILALTASPGSEKQRMQEVCNNLFIEQVQYRSEEDNDVKSYINPIEVTWQWFDLPSEYQYIRSILKNMLDEKLNWLIQRRLISNHPRWIFKRNLINVGEQIQYNIQLTMEEQRGPLYLALSYQASALSLMYCIELIESQGSYSLDKFFNRIESEGRKSHRSLLIDPRIKEIRTLLNKLSVEHPKFNHIVDILKKRYGDIDLPTKYRINKTKEQSLEQNHYFHDSRVLIFTQYRDTARHIVEILSENGIRASRFVGQAKRQGDLGMKQEEQSNILESFRSGEFNVLVATSIAEEGLDIPEVDLVIFYEPIPSEIRYIQRRGRTGRKTAGSVVILAAKDSIDERYLNASKRRVQKMKQVLSLVDTELKPANRSIISPSPMTDDEIELLHSTIRKNDSKLRKEVETKLLSSNENASNIKKSVQKKRQSLLTSEEERLTGQFRRQVDRAARRIHSLLAETGKSGLNFEYICNNIDFDEQVTTEALQQLEKLRRIVWIGDDTVALIDSLKSIPGKTYDVQIEKIIQGRALVTIDGKWHARLNHYDYEGPRDLLKKGKQFKVIGELYSNEGVLNLRIRQII
ncbi:MAG TPA: helicase-related protein [Nitrososphaeraceae archaeon]|jgi:Fanconi anemia group M protein